MAYADVKAAITTHAVAAGAALANPIPDILAAAPVPTGRCVRVAWHGESEPVRMGFSRTLTSELIAQITRIHLFDPVSTLGTDVTALVDTEVKAFSVDLRSRILGDSTLGGTCVDLAMDYAQTEYATIDNTRYRIVTWDVVTDYEEVTRAA